MVIKYNVIIIVIIIKYTGVLKIEGEARSSRLFGLHERSFRKYVHYVHEYIKSFIWVSSAGNIANLTSVLGTLVFYRVSPYFSRCSSVRDSHEFLLHINWQRSRSVSLNGQYIDIDVKIIETLQGIIRTQYTCLHPYALDSTLKTSVYVSSRMPLRRWARKKSWHRRMLFSVARRRQQLHRNCLRSCRWNSKTPRRRRRPLSLILSSQRHLKYVLEL